MLHLRAQSKFDVLVLLGNVYTQSLQVFACSVCKINGIVVLCVIVQLQANLLTTNLADSWFMTSMISRFLTRGPTTFDKSAAVSRIHDYCFHTCRFNDAYCIPCIAMMWQLHCIGENVQHFKTPSWAIFLHKSNSSDTPSNTVAQPSQQSEARLGELFA